MRPLLFALCLPALALVQAQARPRLVLDAPDFDFGKLAPNAIVTHGFIATNAGDTPLTIARLTPGCGCTSSIAGKSTLAPGESTTLEVTFHSAGNSGHVKKTVALSCDDPDRPEQMLTFEAEIQADVIVPTPDVWFRDLDPASYPTASVMVESGTGQPLALTDVKLSRAPWLGVTTREEGQDLWVDLELAARDLPPGKRTGTDTITLVLANPRPQVVTLSVHWERRAQAKTRKPAPAS
ncbi:MAG: DUF1573 domain-containing protein [Holophaga sp.]|jgi:hypothetical protein